MDISAHAVLLRDRPRMGHLGHQGSHAPVRPILHLFSSSRSPRRETGCRGLCLRSLLIFMQFLCSCLKPVPSSRPAHVLARHAQGAVKAGRRVCFASCSSLARPRRDGSEHGATLKQLGATSCIEFALLLRTAQAMRASLLASAIASTLWCSRFLAASIQDLSP